jgi:tryptophan synthase alpha chain
VKRRSARPGNRIDHRLSELKRRGRKAFVTYIVAGYPDAAASLEQMRCLVAAGIDMIEVGYPFSDPVLDGATIQALNNRAVAAGGSLSRTLELCRTFRKDDTRTPLILMGYSNPLASMGYANFARRAAAAGVDGVIVGDMPLREAKPLVDELRASHIHFIPLSAPGLPAEEFAAQAPGVGGFLYCIPVSGSTGGPSATRGETRAAVARCRAESALPILVGFGIKTPAGAAAAAHASNGVVVASVLLDRIERLRARLDSNAVMPALTKEIATFRHAIDRDL